VLSRLASNTVWLARYQERAEALARLTAVTQHLSLLPEYAGNSATPWLDALAVLGGVAAFTELRGEVTPAAAVDYLLIDRENPSSLFCCLRAARENARTARHLLTEAYWDAMNFTWLSAQALDADELAVRGVDDVAQWAMERCYLMRGTADDLLRDDVPHALAIGQALERGDHVARLLAVFLRGELADPDIAVVPGTPVYRRWEALLAASALDESYRRAHTATIDPEKALRLILTHPTSPRSLTVSLRRVIQGLDGLFGLQRAAPATRELISNLEEHLADANDGALLTGHLGTYLTTLTQMTAKVSAAVLNDLNTASLLRAT
jgi:uncharacterized alpha-E superfamily protein